MLTYRPRSFKGQEKTLYSEEDARNLWNPLSRNLAVWSLHLKLLPGVAILNSIL